jgi:CRP-like cAMP-binding protein
MTLDRVPIFDSLSPDDRAALATQAVIRRAAAGDVLFFEGDPADTLYVLVSGRCVLRRGGTESDLNAPALLDAASTLGGLPHRVKATLLEDGEVWGWPVSALWDHPPFADQARRWLASELHAAQDRRDALEAPVHYANGSAQIAPGPFVFDDVTLIFAFCEAHLDFLRPTLPDGVRLFRRPGRARDSVLLALADFPRAYPERDPEACFGYTETTVFVPVRVGYKIGLYVPYIYPSAYEPIVLGREIYGFPKRLGYTVLASHAATLAVDGIEQAALHWDGMDASDEPALVGALLAWLGLERWSMALAFRAGDALRKVMQLPPYRRVSVYNHKRILAVDGSGDTPGYAVDQLTHAIFGVLRWYQIARLRAPSLVVTGGPLAGAGLRLREAYRTQLDMRLSTGRVVRDYGAARPEKTGT